MHRRLVALFALALSAFLAAGCSLCQGPEDYTYGYYGGLYQRQDPVYGRAGSIIDGGGELVAEDAEMIAEEGEVVEEEVYYDHSDAEI